ncbi:hypothetical protein TNIN_277311 [Trichonephila inaurata madagascariensis]|uniref:Uncharacterized protein n=1 Tax=Trichonephila inaurata madagascariensis TaxID=2747483 RepID=A0A8X6IEQ6_9ARAC|nr:hypothetical protein TNIN_277311 [Trichonephila inaurata madagascariensis]
MQFYGMDHYRFQYDIIRCHVTRSTITRYDDNEAQKLNRDDQSRTLKYGIQFGIVGAGTERLLPPSEICG